MEFKLKNLFLAALLLFGFVACSDSKEEPVTPPSDEVSLSIVGASQVALFDFGQTRRFSVESQNVVEFYLDGPTGWAYDLSEGILTVVAPLLDDADYTLEGDVVITYAGADEVEQTATLSVKIDYVAPGTGLEFDVVVSDITSTTASISVTPNDDTVGYYYDVCTAEDYYSVGGNVGLIVSYAIQGFMQQYNLTLQAVLDLMLEYGPSSDTVAYLPANTEMYAFAVAINSKGEAYGTPKAVPFTTLEGGDPSDCTFEFEVTGLTTTSAMLSIYPSDPSVRYWFAVTSVQGYQGDQAMIEETEYYVTVEAPAAYPSMSWEEIINGLTVTGETHEQWYDLSAGVSYYVYAFAMDENGLAVSPLFKQEFTTPLVDSSEAELEVSYKYFDGAALYEADPANISADKVDYYRLQVKVSPNYYTEYWAVALATGDYTNLETYPDDATKTAMLQGGAKFNQEVNSWWIPKNTTACTILAYGSDIYGIDSELVRLLVTPTESGVSPISQYVSASQNQPQVLMQMEPKAPKAIELKPSQKVGRQIEF